MKYVLSVEMWLLKTSIRIVKYKSQAVKSYPEMGKNYQNKIIVCCQG